ncbi:MAG: hypothetical protein H6670_12840 [Anaerolineaceae bacterium]|nr:hypothetical protein [Anaerolineaceae bacterium]
MKRFLILFAVVLMLMATLTACGGDATPTPEDTTTDDTTSQTTDDTSTDDADSDSDAADTDTDADSSDADSADMASMEMTEASFEDSGVTFMYPSGWTAWGAGNQGSLEFAYPNTANVSVRDTAASNNLYASAFGDAESLEAALEFASTQANNAEPTIEEYTSDGGRTVLYTIYEADGSGALLAATDAGDGTWVTVFASAMGEMDLSDDAINTILMVAASMTAAE